MDNEKLISKIFSEIQKDPSNYRAYEDVFSLCRSLEGEDFKLAHDTNAELRVYISRGMQTSAYAKLFDLYKRSLLFDAPHNFDSYLLYLEINRKPEERFYLIYDNCASLKDRGIDLSRKRLLVHLRKYYQQHHSNEGYILLIDYSKYYDNIRHDVFYELVEKYVSDPTALWLLRKTLDRAKVDVSYMDDDEFKNCMHTVFNSLEHAQIDKQLLTGEKFMGKHLNIGDQVAQAAGISYPIPIDNYVKIVCSMPFYARYTDDSYVIDESKEFLEALLKDITVIADTIGITVNLRETRICKLSDYWRFLQVQYSLTETGRVVQKINPKRLTDMRRKMKKVAKKGVITPVAFENWYKSWFKGHYKIMSKLQRQNLDTLFNQLKEVLENVQNHSE